MKPLVRVTGRIAPLDMADVDTDQIIPKQFMKSIERTGYGSALFHDWRASGNFVLDRPEYASASILVTGPNFGCGSSREHAPWALRDGGFQVIIAASFADIFRTNCGNVGLLAATLPEEQVRRLIDFATEAPGSEGSVDLETQLITAGSLRFHFDIAPFLRERLLNGWDEISLTLQLMDKIRAFEATRPEWLPSTAIPASS